MYFISRYLQLNKSTQWTVRLLLVTVDGKRFAIKTVYTNLSTCPIDNSNRYDLNNGLVIDKLPDLGANIPTNETLIKFDNPRDLAQMRYFPSYA